MLCDFLCLRAGLLHENDIVREVNGFPVCTPEQLMETIMESDPTIMLKIVPSYHKKMDTKPVSVLGPRWPSELCCSIRTRWNTRKRFRPTVALKSCAVLSKQGGLPVSVLGPQVVPSYPNRVEHQ